MARAKSTLVVKPIKTRIFREGQSLTDFVCAYLRKLPEDSIIVVTSKIVALAERRTAVVQGPKALEQLVRQESELAWPTPHVWLTYKEGMIMAAAGIDESNGDNKLVLLPRDSFKSSYLLRQQLKKRYRVKNLGVIISDSFVMPLRAGVSGRALGYCGFRGIRDYRGKKDIFGREFTFSSTNVADSLASAANLVMGEGNEQQPLAIIENAPVGFRDKMNRRELMIPIKEDLYRPLFSKLPRS